MIGDFLTFDKYSNYKTAKSPSVQQGLCYLLVNYVFIRFICFSDLNSVITAICFHKIIVHRKISHMMCIYLSSMAAWWPNRLSPSHILFCLTLNIFNLLETFEKLDVTSRNNPICYICLIHCSCLVYIQRLRFLNATHPNLVETYSVLSISKHFTRST